jgi:hypothetical protein
MKRMKLNGINKWSNTDLRGARLPSSDLSSLSGVSPLSVTWRWRAATTHASRPPMPLTQPKRDLMRARSATRQSTAAPRRKTLRHPPPAAAQLPVRLLPAPARTAWQTALLPHAVGLARRRSRCCLLLCCCTFVLKSGCPNQEIGGVHS